MAGQRFLINWDAGSNTWDFTCLLAELGWDHWKATRCHQLAPPAVKDLFWIFFCLCSGVSCHFCYFWLLPCHPPFVKTHHFTSLPCWAFLFFLLFFVFFLPLSPPPPSSSLHCPSLSSSSPYLHWCVCPGSGFWWILSCNGQRAAVVSDVCMTCFLPESISSSQLALFFFWVIPCQASCSQPRGACTDRFTPTQPLSCHLRRFDTLLQQSADRAICLWGAQRYVEMCPTSLWSDRFRQSWMDFFPLSLLPFTAIVCLIFTVLFASCPRHFCCCWYAPVNITSLYCVRFGSWKLSWHKRYFLPANVIT